MSDRHVDHLLIGGGLASANCARWLREAGGDGSILLVGREPEPPYNRPPLSKGYMREKESREETWFRPAEWWQEQRIELKTRTSVTRFDPAARTAKLSSGEEISFGQALLATGANVRRLPVEGAELDGVHYLRTHGNSDAIRTDARDAENVVLIGGSYIGSEVAASLTDAFGCSCTIVMMEEVVLSGGFGKQAGGYFQGVLEEHGIRVVGSDSLARFEGSDGRVRAVVTESGQTLPCDMVVVGAGVTPDVTLAKAAGLEIGERGGVVCDSRLQTAAEGVYVAGDIAEFDSAIHGRHMRIEHWDVAFNHGKTAAHNMLGRDQPYTDVPYFFSDLADWSSMEYLGPATEWDQEIVRGSLEDGEFSLWYVQDGRVAACLSIGRSGDLDHARRLITEGTRLGDRAAALGDLGTDLATLGS